MSLTTVIAAGLFCVLVWAYWEIISLALRRRR